MSLVRVLGVVGTVVGLVVRLTATVASNTAKIAILLGLITVSAPICLFPKNYHFNYS